MPTIEMFFQTIHKLHLASTLLDEMRDIMNNIERVSPFIALGPSTIIACPTTVVVPGLEETSLFVPKRKWCTFGTSKEEISFRFTEFLCKNVSGVIVI